MTHRVVLRARALVVEVEAALPQQAVPGRRWSELKAAAVRAESLGEALRVVRAIGQALNEAITEAQAAQARPVCPSGEP